MPYLFVYLLYYVTKWPVNPVISNQRPEAGSQMVGTWVPCMLHVYWALHAIHAILAGVALWSWWKKIKSLHEATEQTANKSNPSLLPLRTPVQANLRPLTPDSCFLTSFQRLIPWLLLALIFYIPGVYLEWPSDPWDHLGRINEWLIRAAVGTHSSWAKSSYFLAYSIIGRVPVSSQLFWIDYYYTGICLLLCWQYYRFSRACGLGERASMVFVIIQALLFGNNIFSFYRYYGISSSIYAQLGAIALTRIVLEFASRGTKLSSISQEETDGARQCGDGEPRGLRQATRPERSRGLTEQVPTGRVDNKDPEKQRIATDSIAHVLNWFSSCLHALVVKSTPTSDRRPLAPGIWHLTSDLWHLPTVLWLLTSGSCLLFLTAYNHQQGIGIATIAILGIAAWRIIEWKRFMVLWLIITIIILSIIALWLIPRNPALEQFYRPQGYLNSWYGFNLLTLSSPSSDRMMQITGGLGLMNLLAGMVLLRRNHIVGWLTVAPFFILLSPCFSIPFANAMHERSLVGIVTFQRMLFAAPPGLALVYLAMPSRPVAWPQYGLSLLRKTGLKLLGTVYEKGGLVPLIATCIMLAMVTGMPSDRPYYNHTWNALYHVPNDLDLRIVWVTQAQQSVNLKNFALAATSGLTAVKQTQEACEALCSGRVGSVPANDLVVIVKTLAIDDPTGRIVPAIPRPMALFSPYSFAAICSSHWLPQEAAFAFAGAAELRITSIAAGLSPIARDPKSDVVYYHKN
jgi:hypothetical protein